MKKSVMIHVRNNENLDKFINFLRNGYDDTVVYSKEVRFMIEEFINNDYEVYLFSLDNFIDNIWTNVYSVHQNTQSDFNLNELNEKIKTIIVRVIGSVEGNFDNIKNYLTHLLENYHGLVLNNPKAMLRGMTKKYLTQIDRAYLSSIGISTIPTEIFDNKVTIDEITEGIDNLDDYLIKPVSGELSNSLANLAKIDEEFLRYKESKVQGWVRQPIIKDIWNGEYQISFLNKKPIYAQKKIYKTNEDSNIPNQKTRVLEKYNPTDKEIEIIQKLIDYMQDLYEIKIDICRVDFMKDKEDNLILLEFEMVNPGFFIGYMQSYDKDIKKITENIRCYCDENMSYKM